MDRLAAIGFNIKPNTPAEVARAIMLSGPVTIGVYLPIFDMKRIGYNGPMEDLVCFDELHSPALEQKLRDHD